MVSSAFHVLCWVGSALKSLRNKELSRGTALPWAARGRGCPSPPQAERGQPAPPPGELGQPAPACRPSPLPASALPCCGALGSAPSSFPRRLQTGHSLHVTQQGSGCGWLWTDARTEAEAGALPSPMALALRPRLLVAQGRRGRDGEDGSAAGARALPVPLRRGSLA